MARKSRRGKKTSRFNVYLSVFIAAILIVSIGGFYVYETGAKAATSTSTSSSSVASASGTSTASSVQGTGDYAVLQTTQGTIVIQLFPQVAPITVQNFENLANSGFYNGLVWHRLVAGFVIQTGDPGTKGAVNSTRDTWGQGQGPYTEPLEANPAYPNDVGYVAIAHTSSSTSGGSQFYINLANNTALNGQYTVFAKVVSGMGVVDALAALPVYTNPNTFTYDQPIDAQSAILISVSIQSTP